MSSKNINLCQNPECPDFGYCGGKCAEDWLKDNDAVLYKDNDAIIMRENDAITE